MEEETDAPQSGHTAAPRSTDSIAESTWASTVAYILVVEYWGGSRRMVGTVRPTSRPGLAHYPWHVERRNGAAWVRLEPSPAALPPVQVRRKLYYAQRRLARLLGVSFNNGTDWERAVPHPHHGYRPSKERKPRPGL